MTTLYVRFPTSVLEPRRAPLLERLLARASAPVRIDDWRADGFRAIAVSPEPMPPIAPTALCAAGNPAPGAWACIATPVHLTAGMTHVAMPKDGSLTLNDEEAASLAAEFNRVFADAGMRLWVGRDALLLCLFDDRLEVATRDPEEALGTSDVFEFQARGPDAPKLRRLASEMEMWLFDHSVNRARAARGQLPITGFWLWGGGARLQNMPAVKGWTAGQDPLFTAFGSIGDYPSAGGSGVLVCAEHPGSDAWSHVERRWLDPAFRALRSGRLAEIRLSAGAWRFDVSGGVNWRFWRRTRPWWEAFGTKESNDLGIE